MNIHLKNKYFIPAFIACLSSVIVLFGASILLKISPKDLVIRIFTAPYASHINVFLPLTISGINSYILLYAIILCSCLLSFLACMFFKKYHLNFLSILLSSVFIIYTFTTALLMKSWIAEYRRHINLLSGKTMEEKYLVINTRYIYILAQYCKSVLPNDTSAKFITDLDLSTDPGMGYHRMLAYFLYPIDMRDVRKKETNAIIAIAKHHAKESVPDNFEILVTLDEHNLIAVKKKE